MGKHIGFCIVPDCLNMYYPGSTRLHRLPRNEKKKARWLKCLKITEKDFYDGARVCHLHFSFTDYTKNDPETNTLKRNALPSVNEGRRHSDHYSNAESIDIDQVLENLSRSSSRTNIDTRSDLMSEVSVEELWLNMTSSDDEAIKKKVERRTKPKKVTSKPKVVKKKTNVGKRVTIICPEEKQRDFVEESASVEQDDVEEVEKEKQETKPGTVEPDDKENMLRQVCRTCLATECKLYSIKQCDFERAYLILTGIRLDMFETSKMPQMLCFECVQRFRNFIEFSATSIKAAHLLMGLIREDKLTMANIKSIDRKKILLTSKLVTTRFKSNHFNIRLEEHEYENNCINEALSDMDANILEEDIKHGIGDTEASDNPDNQDNNATDEPMEVDLDDHSKIEVETDLDQGAEDNRRELDEESDRWEEEDDNLPVIEQETEQVSRDTGGPQQGGQVPNGNEYCFRGKRGITKKIMKKEFNKMFIEKALTPLEQRGEINNRKNGREYIKAKFKCDKCYRGFQTEKSFIDHMKKHNNASGEFVCDICQVHFRTRGILVNHIRNSHWVSYSCRRCSFVTTFVSAAVTHKNIHEGFRFHCKMCPKNYAKLASYLEHTRRFHPEDVVCHLCGLSFALVRDLDRHLCLTHKKENLHLLPATESSPYGQVRRTETTNYVAVRYVTTLPEDAPHCPTCDIRFLDDEALRAHLSHSLSHGNNSVGQDKKQNRCRSKRKARQTRVKKEAQEPVICEQCGEDFINFHSYGCHFALQHPYESRTQYPDSRRREHRKHMCDVCGRIYQSVYSLRDHRESHDGAMHPCDKCDKKFSTKVKLSVHKLNHAHSQKCDVCGKKFGCVTNLNRHMRLHTHKPYSCETCNKRFSTQSEKQMHIRHVHMGVPWPKKRPKDAPKLRRRRCTSSSSS